MDEEERTRMLEAWYSWLPRMAQLAVDKRCPDQPEKTKEWLDRREKALDSVYLGVGGSLMILFAMAVGLAWKALTMIF